MIESERRNPCVDLRNCVAIKFGDGQDWHVPKPRLQIIPGFDGVKVELRTRVTYGATCDALVETIAIAGDEQVQLAAIVTLAASLLRENYDLADGELDQLLSLEPPDWMCHVVVTAAGHSGTQRAFARGE